MLATASSLLRHSLNPLTPLATFSREVTFISSSQQIQITLNQNCIDHGRIDILFMLCFSFCAAFTYAYFTLEHIVYRLSQLRLSHYVWCFMDWGQAKNILGLVIVGLLRTPLLVHDHDLLIVRGFSSPKLLRLRPSGRRPHRFHHHGSTTLLLNSTSLNRTHWRWNVPACYKRRKNARGACTIGATHQLFSPPALRQNLTPSPDPKHLASKRHDMT